MVAAVFLAGWTSLILDMIILCLPMKMKSFGIFAIEYFRHFVASLNTFSVGIFVGLFVCDMTDGTSLEVNDVLFSHLI